MGWGQNSECCECRTSLSIGQVCNRREVCLTSDSCCAIQQRVRSRKKRTYTFFKSKSRRFPTVIIIHHRDTKEKCDGKATCYHLQTPCFRCRKLLLCLLVSPLVLLLPNKRARVPRLHMQGREFLSFYSPCLVFSQLMCTNSRAPACC